MGGNGQRYQCLYDMFVLLVSHVLILPPLSKTKQTMTTGTVEVSLALLGPGLAIQSQSFPDFSHPCFREKGYNMKYPKGYLQSLQ
jgi:hypothetical protein